MMHRRDLDEVSKNYPVIVRHCGGDPFFYNSKAFEIAGVTKDTPIRWVAPTTRIPTAS